MKKKGFTLIEVLSVIVIIGILSIITVPTIIGLMDKANKASYKDSVYGYIDAANLYLTSNLENVSETDEYNFICDGTSCKYKNEELVFKGEVPKSGLISIKGNGETTIENLYNGRYYANKEENGEVVVTTEQSDALSRDELTKRIVALEELVQKLSENKAEQTDLDVVATIAQSAKDEGATHATKTELDAVASVAQNAEKVANNSATKENLDIVASIANSNKEALKTVATQSSLEAVSSIANSNKEALKTMATQTDLEAINTIVQTNQTDISSLTTKHNSDVSTINGKISTNTTNIATNKTNIATNKTNIATNKTSISNLGNTYATKTQLDSVSTIASNAQNLAKAAATQSSLDTVSTIANNAQNLAKAAATQSSLETVATAAKAAQDAAASKVTKAEALNATYPVGSIYVTTVYDTAAKVASALGGTWEAYGAGKMLVGADGSTYKAGSTGGSSSVTLGVANLPSHNHTFTGTSKSYTSGNQSADHTHSIPALSGSAASSGSGMSASVSSYANVYREGWTSENGYHSHEYVRNNSNTPYSHQGNGGYVWWDSGRGNTGGAGSHTHTVGYYDYYANGISVSGLTPHTHSVSTNASTTGGISANHTHTTTVKPEGTISSTGDGTSFSVQNPYVVVYMWKRKA